MSSIDQTKPLCRRLDPVLLLPLVIEMRNKERSVLCMCVFFGGWNLNGVIKNRDKDRLPNRHYRSFRDLFKQVNEVVSTFLFILQLN